MKITKMCIFDKPSTRFFMEIMKFTATPLVYFNSKHNFILIIIRQYFTAFGMNEYRDFIFRMTKSSCKFFLSLKKAT